MDAAGGNLDQDHASGAVAPEDAETVQVGDAIGQRAKRRGLVQGAARPVRVIEVLWSSGESTTGFVTGTLGNTLATRSRQENRSARPTPVRRMCVASAAA
jgi:hypothetical protein